MALRLRIFYCASYHRWKWLRSHLLNCGLWTRRVEPIKGWRQQVTVFFKRNIPFPSLSISLSLEPFIQMWRNCQALFCFLSCYPSFTVGYLHLPAIEQHSRFDMPKISIPVHAWMIYSDMIHVFPPWVYCSLSHSLHKYGNVVLLHISAHYHLWIQIWWPTHHWSPSSINVVTRILGLLQFIH